jgi:TRAP-type mannitol/chloroaromatic compound transport system permease small subunit
MPFIKRFVTVVDSINDGIGRVISFLVYPMIGVLVWEVFMRYVFNRPTIWAHELSALFYAVFFLLGGAYTLRWKAHINVDVLYVRLSPRSRAMIDLLTWLLFYFFCGVLVWQGAQAGWKSFMRLERASTVWEPYIWPVKCCIPLAAFLMLLQGATKTISDVYRVVTNRDLLSENKTRTGP